MIGIQYLHHWTLNTIVVCPRFFHNGLHKTLWQSLFDREDAVVHLSVV
jgi:hypothetical protein